MRKIKEFFPEVKDYYYISENGEVISKARKQTKTLKPGLKKMDTYKSPWLKKMEVFYISPFTGL